MRPIVSLCKDSTKHSLNECGKFTCLMEFILFSFRHSNFNSVTHHVRSAYLYEHYVLRWSYSKDIEYSFLRPKVLNHHFAVCNKYSHLFLVLLNFYNGYNVSIKISNTRTLNIASYTTENPQVEYKLNLSSYKI